jgi:putative intracellular protease/amidase
MTEDVKTVAFVLYPGLTPLDLVGPLQVMSGLEVAEATFGIQPRHHVVVVAEDLDAVPTDTPVRVAATSTLAEVPEPDIVMVPGGGAPTLRQLVNPVLLDYLREADRTPDRRRSVGRHRHGPAAGGDADQR